MEHFPYEKYPVLFSFSVIIPLEKITKRYSPCIYIPFDGSFTRAIMGRNTFLGTGN
jgi:hypothetical protein